MTIVYYIAELILLVVGAEALVKGASRLAAAFRISPLIIALTVVAFGTSALELAVSIKAALADQTDIAIDNRVGSNIFSLMGVLGVAFACVPVFLTGGHSTLGGRCSPGVLRALHHLSDLCLNPPRSAERIQRGAGLVRVPADGADCRHHPGAGSAPTPQHRAR